MGRIVQDAIAEIRDRRPFLDTEHGPIHSFKDHKRTLPEPFDDEYFRHMQWAHLASGGAGGGMRWPNRTPHALTRGMRRAQLALTGFLPLIDWAKFQRSALNLTIECSSGAVTCFGCGDDAQAVIWLLRTDSIGRNGTLCTDAKPVDVHVRVPGLFAGHYSVTGWDTREGRVCAEFEAKKGNEACLQVHVPPFATDVALAIRRQQLCRPRGSRT
jgi:mannan endo-1,4-beta-mannosidase